MTTRLPSAFSDRAVVASVSGGKDSTAKCLYLQEQEIPFQPVFMDTGWENEATYEYLAEELPKRIGPITMLRAEIDLPTEVLGMAVAVEAILGISPSPMVRLCLKKGMFPARQLRWCSELLKVMPLIGHLHQVGSDAISAVGIRAAESPKRALMTPWEYNPAFRCWVWRPLLRWSEDDVIAMHRRHGMRPNPNYLQGACRVGCSPCIFSRKLEIRAIADRDPRRIRALRLLEELVNQVAKERFEAKGETLRHRRAFFQRQHDRKIDPITGKRDGSCSPIDEVVRWSRTSYGGKVIELFDLAPEDQGCLRWGLCEMPGDIGPELPSAFVARACANPGCNNPITGRADRKTCGPTCRKAVSRLAVV